MQRRYFLGVLASAYAWMAHASNKNYPQKSIKIIVGSTAGALTDVASRVYAERITGKFGVPVVVENIAGASSTIAINSFLKTEPDGYTLLAVANTVYTFPHLSEKAKYSPIKDFVPVAELARGPGVLVVNGQSPHKTLVDFIAAAKKKPSGLSYASGGMGTTSHLPMEMFQKEAKVELLHVPYKGVAPAVIDLIGGRVDSMMGTPTSMLSALKNGQIRPLAITSEERSAEFPDIPTFKELGFPQVTYIIYISLVTRAGISKDMRVDIATTFNAVKNDPALLANLSKLGQEVDLKMNDLNALDIFLLEDEAKYAKLIKENNIRME